MFYLAMAMAIITRVLQFPLDHISKRTMLIDVATKAFSLFVESNLNTSLNAWLAKINSGSFLQRGGHGSGRVF